MAFMFVVYWQKYGNKQPLNEFKKNFNTKIRHMNCHNSGVKTCVFLFTCVYTIFFIVNRYNTREYTFFINKIIRENAALFLVKKLPNIHLDYP